MIRNELIEIGSHEQKSNQAKTGQDNSLHSNKVKKGGMIFGTLQICKNTQIFNQRLRKIQQTNKHVAAYLKKTRPLSLKFAKLTNMFDPEASALPVVKSDNVRETETVIYNRINKCGSSTTLSKMRSKLKTQILNILSS